MSKYSYTAAQAARDVSNGEDWRIAYFNLVDFFRREKNVSIIKDPPTAVLPQPERAMLQAIVCQLCFEFGIEIPDWALEMNFLKRPWFVSGVKNLYASALKESPLFFRRNNIFVLSNFMNRC